jgi:lipopolysaccharide/colanic/teichoic acid biosynthesis glycosyltransferase
MKQTGIALLTKHALDRTAALGALAVTLPIIGIAAIAVRATMGRPIFFRQARAGRHGRPFEIIKMRTMTPARAGDGRMLPDEQRLTRLGTFLRAWSIDELPQLWNVLRGDLSLVGPRPLLLEYLPLYTEEQARRHEVMPGMTGLAQISGRNALTWDEKFALDSWYVRNWSLALDARILARTAASVVRRRGITVDGDQLMPAFPGRRVPAERGPS